jgi:hypothetical protein
VNLTDDLVKVNASDPLYEYSSHSILGWNIHFSFVIGDLPVTTQIQFVRPEQLHETLRMTSLCVMTSFTLLPAIVQGGQDVSGK